MFYIFSILYALLIFLLDRTINDVVLIPMLSLFWLMLASFFRRSLEVIQIACILLFFVIYSLRLECWEVILISSITFVVGSTLAVIVATLREQAADRFKQLSLVIKSVPMIVVVSDSQGSIIATSDVADSCIHSDYHPLIGHALPDILLSHLHPTEAIRTHQQWFQREGSFECEICLPGLDKVHHQASVECLGNKGSRLMIICVKPNSSAK